MYVLIKWEADPQIFGLQLNGFTAAPTLLWTIDLGALDIKNGNGNDAIFKTFSEDHASAYDSWSLGDALEGSTC